MNNLSWLGRTLGLTVGATIGLAGLGALAAIRRPLPRTTGTLRLSGLRDQVRVLRDRWGVPHIYAQHNDDLFMALGYTHAQERLWQMEVNRRTGHGQLSELFGDVALSSDSFVRTLGFSRLARRDYALLDDMTRTVIDAYVRGVNAFLSIQGNPLSLEFTLLRYTPRPWESIDVLVWARVMALNLSCNWTTELLNAQLLAMVGTERARFLMPFYPNTYPITVPTGISYSKTIGEGALRAATAAAPFLNQVINGHGSNGWVVSGTRSTSGKPLLANDTHLGLTIPGIWYEAHLVGGDYNVTGYTFPGAPGIIIGHNDRIAWGITNAAIDNQDIYIERLHPDNPLLYAWHDDWEQAEVVREEIVIKGRTDNTSVTEEVRITRHGPIVSSIAGPDVSVWRNAGVHSMMTQEAQEQATTPPVVEELALRWSALDPVRIFRAVLKLNLARDWDTFRDALADWNVPPQNFVYADVDGHYGYALGGDVPIRAQGDGHLPVPGWTGAYEWTGYIPAAALPVAYDPPEHVVVTANNRIAGDDYVFADALQGEWLNGYRAIRIRELLDYSLRHNVCSFGRIQSDVRSLPGLDLARLVVDLPLTDPLERQVRDILVAWDGELTADSIGGAIYDTWRYYLTHSVYAELGDLLHSQAGLGIFGILPGRDYLMRAFPNIIARIAAAKTADWTDPWLGANRTWVHVLQMSLTLTVDELRRRLGVNPTQWKYGRIHCLTLRHALGSQPTLKPIFNRGPWETGGDMDTVCMGYAPRKSAVGPVYIAPSQRLICDVSDWDASLSILPNGQSGHPGSSHYADMNGFWRKGEYHPMLWSHQRVEEHTIARLVLEPESSKA